MLVCIGAGYVIIQFLGRLSAAAANADILSTQTWFTACSMLLPCALIFIAISVRLVFSTIINWRGDIMRKLLLKLLDAQND